MQKMPNPASRLIKIIELMLPASRDSNVKNAWCHAFGLAKDDQVGVVKAMADFFELIEIAKQAIRKAPDVDHEIFLASFPEIQRLLDPSNLHNSWDPIRNELMKPHVLQGLKFCDDLLSRTAGEAVVDPKVLDDLSRSVSEAMNAINKDTSLPPMLRSVLCTQLNGILQSIAEYRIWGIEAIKASLERAVGALIAQQSLLEGQMSSNGFTKFKGTLKAVAEVVESVKTISQPLWSLGASSMKLLGG